MQKTWIVLVLCVLAGCSLSPQAPRTTCSGPCTIAFDWGTMTIVDAMNLDGEWEWSDDEYPTLSIGWWEFAWTGNTGVTIADDNGYFTIAEEHGEGFDTVVTTESRYYPRRDLQRLVIRFDYH